MMSLNNLTTFANRRLSISRLHFEVIRFASERCQVCVTMSATLMTQQRRVTRSATVVGGNCTDAGWMMSLVVSTRCWGCARVRVRVRVCVCVRACVRACVCVCVFAQCFVALDQESLMCVHLFSGVMCLVIYLMLYICCCL